MGKYCAMKLSQIRRRIELCMREIGHRFEMKWLRYQTLISFETQVGIMSQKKHGLTRTPGYNGGESGA
jgi:hypothetical protein